MCRLLEVSKQGYYDWRKIQKYLLALRHEYLTNEIVKVFKKHHGRYGSPRVAKELYDKGIETNKRVVARLMRDNNLIAKGYHRRKASYGKPKDIETIVKENLLLRNFDSEKVDDIWVTDITYISCSDGRLYLSTYIDLATRIPRCFKISTNMKKHIVSDPLKYYTDTLPNYIHSDRGPQYRSYDYQDLLEKFNIQHSMSAPGTPVDNAVIESFHKTIKRELIYPNKNKTKSEMRVLIENYLGDYYTNERIHTKFMTTPLKEEERLRELN